jgi:hypothetical protein
LTKLSDLRRALRTGTLEAELSERSAAPASLRQYKLNKQGTDAVLMFGKHKGEQLSFVVKKDPSYMNWILENAFPGELKDVVRHVLAARDATDMADATDKLAAAFVGVGKWKAEKRKR